MSITNPHRFLTVIFMLVTIKLAAQPENIDKRLYQASAIPDSLKQNANAVVRFASENVYFKETGTVVLKRYSLITLLNDKAEDEARLEVPYEKKYNPIGSIFMKVYNADGTLLKKYSRSDMYDGSASDDETIVTNDRFLALKHTVSSYPVTVEVYYESDLSSYTNLGPWYAQEPETAIEKSVLNVTVTNPGGFRYKSVNFKLDPAIAPNNTYTWQVKNLKAFKPEEYIPAWRTAKKVIYATNNFKFYGLNGNLGTWAEFGSWIQSLNADVNTLSPKRVAEVQAMVAGCHTAKERVKLLYEYLQHNMRYVSIQLGVGGLKPFAASFVDEKKYGDCKALANYMYALLRAVNIPSYYAIVNAGTNGEPADDKFTYNSFNHVILCVPLKNDTTWLECTSTTQPFGKLGTFTENRKALLITDQGGKLVNTPKSTCDENTFKGEVHVTLDASGGAKAKMKLLSTGEFRDLYLGMQSHKVAEQKEYLLRSLNIKQPAAFDINGAGDKDGIKEIDSDLEYDRFCDVAAGDKYFYRPAVFDLWRVTLPENESRKSDFYFDLPMHKSCTTIIDIPAGYEVETMPANADLKFSYGNFSLNYMYDKDKNQITSYSSFKLLSQQIPAAKYKEMQVYMSEVARAQNKKLVIHKKAS